MDDNTPASAVPRARQKRQRRRRSQQAGPNATSVSSKTRPAAGRPHPVGLLDEDLEEYLAWADITPEEIDAATPKREAIYRAVQAIKAKDDVTRGADGVGFSRFDRPIGWTLADKSELAAEEAAFGRRLAYKYRKQLRLSSLIEIFGDICLADLEGELG